MYCWIKSQIHKNLHKPVCVCVFFLFASFLYYEIVMVYQSSSCASVGTAVVSLWNINCIYPFTLGAMFLYLQYNVTGCVEGIPINKVPLISAKKWASYKKINLMVIRKILLLIWHRKVKKLNLEYATSKKHVNWPSHKLPKGKYL